jgi:hypothetical protein
MNHWLVKQLHEDCPQCEECTEAAVAHAENTQAVRGSSSYVEVSSNGQVFNTIHSSVVELDEGGLRRNPRKLADSSTVS